MSSQAQNHLYLRLGDGRLYTVSQSAVTFHCAAAFCFAWEHAAAKQTTIFVAWADDERRPKFAVLSIPNSVAFIALIERAWYEKNLFFGNSSRHRGHTLSDSQHCPGCARALHDKIPIGDTRVGDNYWPNRVASRLGRHSHRDRICWWGGHMCRNCQLRHFHPNGWRNAGCLGDRRQTH